MSDKRFELNEKEVKLLKHLLCQLEKRIYLLRISLFGDTEKYSPNGEIMQEAIEKEKDFFKSKYNLSVDEYKLMVASCEIETCIRRISHEMEKSQTYESLKDVIAEFKNEVISFKKHQEMIEKKKNEIEELKELLFEEQSGANIQLPSSTIRDTKEKTGDGVASFGDIDFFKKLMDHKVQSQKNYYDYKTAELEENIEWFQRETRLQVHANAQAISFWLLKYDVCSEKLDFMLKEAFDNWAEKRREYEILRKFRRLNLERIQKLHKLISEREKYIEKDRIKKEKEQKKREEELRKENAATTIQAFWRGTMVRKHLGPYKKKKKKKGKKGKGKKSSGTKKK